MGIGSLTGFINGFFGGGGGMIIVPLLNFILKYPPKVCHATALAIILPISIISGVTYLIKGQMDWLMFLYVTIGSVVGGIMGAFLLKKIKAKWLVKIFAVVMLIAGVKLLFF